MFFGLLSLFFVSSLSVLIPNRTNKARRSSAGLHNRKETSRTIQNVVTSAQKATRTCNLHDVGLFVGENAFDGRNTGAEGRDEFNVQITVNCILTLS
jgi:hypothetical protein